MKTQFLQGDDAAATINDGSCDSCLISLADVYELDSMGNIELPTVEDANDDLVGFLCKNCRNIEQSRQAVASGQIGWLIGGAKLHFYCTACRENGAKVFRENIGDYSQRCNACKSTIVMPKTPMWPELFACE